MKKKTGAFLWETLYLQELRAHVVSPADCKWLIEEYIGRKSEWEYDDKYHFCTGKKREFPRIKTFKEVNGSILNHMEWDWRMQFFYVSTFAALIGSLIEKARITERLSIYQRFFIVNWNSRPS